jgi:hypothetical protein
MIPRRRRSTRRKPAPRLEVEDLLHDIFLRLPPQPSLLPRLSLVCKQWRSILSSPQFLRTFRERHREPPLLGFFVGGNFSSNHVFTPVLSPPDCVPDARFPLPWRRSPQEHWSFADCRDGLAVLINQSRREAVVWDPLTDRQRRVPFPPGLDDDNGKRYWHGALLCVDPEDGHVHCDCLSSPFKLVLICGGCMQAFACLYESASDAWGDVASTATTDNIGMLRPSVLVGSTLCWLLAFGHNILEYDYQRQTFGVIHTPADARNRDWSLRLLRNEDGGLGLAALSELSIQLWEMKLDSHGVEVWVLLQKTIPLEGLIFPPRIMRDDQKRILIVGYDEDTNVIVLSTRIGDFMLHIESARITNISRRNYMCCKNFYPYRNFYTVGNIIPY